MSSREGLTGVGTAGLGDELDIFGDFMSEADGPAAQGSTTDERTTVDDELFIEEPAIASSGLDIPSVAFLRQRAAQVGSKRGRRSALLIEALREVAPVAPKASPEEVRAARVKSAAKARACKRPRKPEATPSVGDREAAAENEAIVLAPTKTIIRIEPEVLEELRSGTQSADAASNMAECLAKLAAVPVADEESSVLVTDFCRTTQHVISSVTARALRLALDRRRMTESLTRLASAIVCSDRAATKALGEALASSTDLKPIMFLECVSYDETPMQVKVETLAWDTTKAEDSASPPGDMVANASSSAMAVSKTVLGVDTGPSKLFQTNVTISLLARGTSSDGSPGDFFLVSSNPVTWIQLLETSSAEVLKAALQRTSLVSVAANACALKVRAATSDRLAANLAAERSLTNERGESWAGLQVSCDIHCCAGAQTKVFDLLGPFVSHMIHLSLSLRLSGNMKRFRACVARVVASRLKVLKEPPSADADRYKEFCLDLFLSKGTNAPRRRMLLWWWCNGDWRDTASIQHFPGAAGSQNLSIDQLCAQMTKAILVAVAGRTPSTFPRHRWTGADLSVDELGLMQCLHGVLTHAYCAYLVACGHKGARGWDFRQPSGSAGSSAAALADGGLRAADEADSDSDHDEDQPDLDEQAALTGAGGSTDQSQKDTDWAKLNRKCRNGGFAFVSEFPLGKLILMRKCLQPLAALMGDHFRLSGERWEQGQRAAQAQAIAEGRTEIAREFRVVEAAAHRLEDKFFASLTKLIKDKQEWCHLPWYCLTESFNTLCFKMLSRAGCAIQELLVKPHEGYPCRLFLLLEEPDLAESFADARKCELDSFSEAFIAHFAEEGLASPAALACLATIAQHLKLDIADIESRHASVRRFVKSVPMAPNMSAKVLSAAWACSRFAKRQAMCGATFAKKEEKGKGRKRVGKKKPKHCRGGRTPFQAFVAKVSAGQKADFAALHKRFAKLKGKEKQYYIDMAKSVKPARDKQRGPSKPFGMSLQKARANAKRIVKLASWKKHRATMSEADRLKSICADAKDSCESVDLAVQQAVREHRFDMAEDRATEQASSSALVAYRTDPSRAVPAPVASLVSAVPGGISSLIPTPTSFATAFDFAPDSATLGEKALAYMKHTKRTNLEAGFDLDWAQKVEIVLADGLPPIPPPSKEEKAWLQCRMAGVCLCSPDGKKLKSFCNQLLTKVIKAVCKTHTPSRQELVDGGFVLALQDLPLPERGAIISDIVPPDCSKDPRQATFWLHIGLMYLSPFRPTFQRMNVADKQSSDDSIVHLKAAGTFLNFHQTFEETRRDRLWWGRLFKLRDTVRPLPCITPGEVSVIPKSGPILFWNPRRQPSRRRVVQEAGDADVAGAIADDASGPEAEPEGGSESDGGTGEEDNKSESGDEQGPEDAEAPWLGQVFEDLLEEIMVEAEVDELRAGVPLPQEPPVEVEGASQRMPSMQAIVPQEASSPHREVGEANPLAGEVEAAGAGLALVELAPAPPPAPRPRRAPDGALDTTYFHGGFISFYAQAAKAKPRFQATCGNPEHGSCRLTRAALAFQKEGARLPQGRPLGLMAAWLAAGESQVCPTRAEHEAIVGFLTHADRCTKRAELLATENGRALAAHERPCRPGEADEPEGLA